MRAIERYRDFIDSASDGIVVLDGSGAVLYLNRAAEEVTGYARDGLSGKPIVQIVPEPFRATLERQIGRAIAGEPIDNFDLELVTTSGDRITVSVASIGILSEHDTAIFSFRDVTLARELDRELRRTSEFLNRILNSTVDGIIAANMRGTILLFNQGAERICGYKAGDVIGRMSVRKLYPSGIAREVMRLIRSAEHGGGGRLEPVRRHLSPPTASRFPCQIPRPRSCSTTKAARSRPSASSPTCANACTWNSGSRQRPGEAGGLGEAGGRDGAGGRRGARAQSAADVGDGVRAGADAQARTRRTRTCGRQDHPRRGGPDGGDRAQARRV